MKPRLLDLFCGAGGAAMGYHRAGWDVVGVDLHPQPDYPFEFIQADATRWAIQAYEERCGDDFDAIHASPPCQAFTSLRSFGRGQPDTPKVNLIPQTRALLEASGLPYVIENVPGAPLVDPVQLCGSSFDIGVRRHRMFECSFPVMRLQCQHHEQPEPIAVYGDHPQQPGDRTYRVRRARSLVEGQRAMGIDWMPWRPLTQAIPPAYTEFIGAELLRQLGCSVHLAG